MPLNEDDEKPSDGEDLTRIEDLGEYLHESEQESEEGGEVQENTTQEEWAGEAVEEPEIGTVEEIEATPVENEAIEEFPSDESQTGSIEEADEWAESEAANEEEESEEVDTTEEEWGGEAGESVADELSSDQEVTEEVLPDGDIQPAPEASQPPETFEDLRHFAGAITYGNVAARGTPPFTIIVNHILRREDASGIMALLRDHNICTDENKKDFELGFEQGAVIIPQISEYSAVYLAHKLRRFDVDIQIGLSDEIRPSPSYEREGRGLVGKDNFQQEIREEVSLEKEWMELDHILDSTTSVPEGYEVREYFGVVVAHVVMGEREFFGRVR